MTVLVITGLVMGTLVLLVATSILNGFALSVLWGWFIVPTFSAPPLGLVSAIGIALVVSFMTHQTQSDDQKKRAGVKIAETFAIGILKPLLALLVGWILLFFM